MAAHENGHVHDEGTVCNGCRFRRELAGHLEWAAGQDEHVWHDVVGEIIELMTTATAALVDLRSDHLDGEATDPAAAEAAMFAASDAAGMAASTISRLGGAIDELWHALMDDAAEHDPSAGL
jgi:hypothetical protein